jgi:hypothetical protein
MVQHIHFTNTKPTPDIGNAIMELMQNTLEI